MNARALALVALTACGGAPAAIDAGNDATPAVDAVDVATAVDAAQDVAMGDATGDASSPAAACTGVFGTALPAGFGRVDGTVLAVVTPADTSCPMPNGTHVIVEVTMGGAVYRMVVNIASDTGPDTRVYFADVPHALPPPAWSDGFHAVALDYATTLGIASSSPAFALETSDALTQLLATRVAVGAHVAIYAQGSGGASSHDVHRFGSNQDGAIVLDPDGASPGFLLFHFAEQTF